MRRFHGLALAVLLGILGWLGELSAASASGSKPVRAGAAAVDVSPEHFPAIVSGGFLEKQADAMKDPLFVRALVLDDGMTRLAMVVVDTLFVPRDLADAVKEEIQGRAGIPANRILISATHTHSAPSLAGALGTGVDEHYRMLLPPRIVECVCKAAESLTPAKVGWATVRDGEHTNCRRWIRRPDRIGSDPFGGQTVRAMMHPGYQNPDYVGPAGPEDPWLSILAVKSSEGRPIALVANYSMHYYGSGPVSADYYGRFVQKIAETVDPGAASGFVAMMSQGTSGDLHWMDYGRPANPPGIDAYAESLADLAIDAYRKINYHNEIPLAMAETKLRLRRRLPNQERLNWARQTVEAMGDRKPNNRTEVYACEQLLLAAEPERELKLQALRIGDLGITAIPCEVYGITGLKIKAQSPLQPTFNVELANGCEGYIPPPEQHKLGGYTTWPARSAGLEEGAEPKIVEAVLSLLEDISGRSRRKPTMPESAYARGVLADGPIACWRLGDFQGPAAIDDSGNGFHGHYEDGIALYLDGPKLLGPCDSNRAAHCAGGRMHADVGKLGKSYSVELWFWNGLPNDARSVTGYLFSRGTQDETHADGDHLGIAGTAAELGPSAGGRLFVCNGDIRRQAKTGRTEIVPKTWNHVVLVRDGSQMRVHLNGNVKPEIVGDVAATYRDNCGSVFVGGRNDGFANFEGKIAWVSLYDRPLSPGEIAAHHGLAAGVSKATAPMTK